MILGDVWQKIFPFSVLTVVKGGMLFALGLYVLFALIVLRQVYMMTGVIVNRLNWLIRLFAWCHLLLAIFAFLFAFLFL